MAGTPVEIFSPTPEPVTQEPCLECGKTGLSQVYVITLERPNITREWFFCTLKHLRAWANRKGLD